jgi:perosamine synthetase
MIPVTDVAFTGNELAYVTECIETGWVSSLGKYVKEFEERFAAYCGAKHGIAVSNGTTALHLALAVLGIGPGDEVIVPTLTFIATANAVAYTGAQPVFVDSEPRTWNLDPAKIEAKITSRTKAIIPVHIYGHPADMDPILEIARRRHLLVIEDAAEAHGALYKGKRVGALADMSCFSFYGNKIITTGEGGMILTDNPVWDERARVLRDHGMSKTKRYWHPEVGYNYRLTNMQAALGVAQLEQIDRIIAAKRGNAALYNRLLKDVPGVILPPEADWAQNVYWMYSILLGERFGIERDELMKRLKAREIDSRPFFYPIHTMPPYLANAAGQEFPVAVDLSRRGLNLPSSATLTPEQIAQVCQAIKESQGAI